MTITEMLQIADRIVLSQTGKHLDDIQEAVIRGVWQDKTYEQIGEECNRSEGRVRDVGYRLWEILSKQLGEDINKCNIRSTFERFKLTSSQYINIQSSRDFTFCTYPHNSIKSIEKKLENNQVSYHNLKQAPRVTKCYGRNQELSNLSQILTNPEINLISVLGLAGIGKTTLVRNLINNHIEDFEIIIWKNLKLGQSLSAIIKETLVNINSEVKNSDLCTFLDLLTDKKCLIILDHFEEVFTPQQFAGHYQPQYQDYQTFIQMITEIEHQSCLLLISREKSSEINHNQFSYCLELSGLDESAQDILQQQGLKNQERWLELINLYEGNPKFLQEISILIKDIFNGNVDQFLNNNLVLTDHIKSIFDAIWLRLSEIERKILLNLVKPENLTENDHQISVNPLSTDQIKGLQSLKQRFLITNSQTGLNLVSAMFREYLILDSEYN